MLLVLGGGNMREFFQLVIFTKIRLVTWKLKGIGNVSIKQCYRSLNTDNSVVEHRYRFLMSRSNSLNIHKPR